MLSIPAAGAWDRASAPGKMPELYDRVVSQCLDEKRDYLPVFLSLDPMNRTSTLITTLMIDTGAQELYVDRHATPVNATGVAEEMFSDLRQRAADYANRRSLDPFQRACVAQCIGYQWYKDTPENSESPGDMANGVGNCRHSTYMATYFQQALGVNGRIQNNGISDMIAGIGHTYSQVEIEGRPFVMNNNLSGDVPGDICAFRFERSWEKHRECTLFSTQSAKYFKGYAKAWNRSADPITGQPTPFTGSVTSCGSDSVSIENGRVSGVLVRKLPESPKPSPSNQAVPAGSTNPAK